MMCFVIASIVMSILDSYPTIQKSTAFISVDCTIAGFFTIEFILRLYARALNWRLFLKFFKGLLRCDLIIYTFVQIS
jgi:hypothetical protein